MWVPGKCIFFFKDELLEDILNELTVDFFNRECFNKIEKRQKFRETYL